MTIDEAKKLIDERAALQKAHTAYAYTIPPEVDGESGGDATANRVGVFSMEPEQVRYNTHIREDLGSLGHAVEEKVRILVCDEFERRITVIEGKLGSEAGLTK